MLEVGRSKGGRDEGERERVGVNKEGREDGGQCEGEWREGIGMVEGRREKRREGGNCLIEKLVCNLYGVDKLTIKT